VRDRLRGMHEFINTIDGWYEQMLHVPPDQIMRLIRLGSKVIGLLKFVGGAGRAAPSRGKQQPGDADPATEEL
jgi:hypothetical protein